ncbi:MAG TPA: glutamate--tRNA ligase [Gaiellaceae bacterium]|nr:glutamate--tRNA ligase [Gaiellaceae bacterium]
MTSPVRVRMAPSPTGMLHIGSVRTFLFNWLFARQHDGEVLLRIENTDTSREVAEATEQIQRSLGWLGIDWDGAVRFQLDRMEDAQRLARQLVEEGKAYEDEGAIRFRMPDEGTTGWVDVIRGAVEVPNESIEDVVIVRADGRPTYNFANPVDDMLDGITHVIRGQDHISNTPKQLQILRALGAEPPVYAHAPDVLGTDGKKLSKRHGAQSVEDFRRQGYIPEALINFLARLGWAYDDQKEVFTRDELLELFRLDRVTPSPAVFDYQKLAWLNGVHLRNLPPEEYADRVVRYLRETGIDWDEELVRRAAPLVQEKIETLDQFSGYTRFFFEEVEPGAPPDGAGTVLEEAEETLAGVAPFEAGSIEQALRALAERLGLKPRDAFQPIRIAVTGSKVSPGLFESIELLGRDETVRRLAAARGAAA